MKKKFLKLKNLANLDAIKRRIKNSFTEKGQEAADAIRALIDELEASDVEIDEKAFADEVEAVINSYMEESEYVPPAVADAIAKRMKALQNSMPKSETFTPAVKNQIAAAILRAGNKEQVENAVNAVLVKNEITGLTFSDVVDFSIVTKFEDLNGLFSKFHRTYFTRFFYSDDDMVSADVLAKQWDKTKADTITKAIQELTVTPKQIQTDYIYKRQRAAFKDLDEIEAAGQTSNFLTWLNNELDIMIINSILMAILIGDATNSAGNKITTFETIGSKAATDAFTYVGTAADWENVTVEAVRALCDNVRNPYGKDKILILSQRVLTQLSAFIYATGGTTTYLSREDVAGILGVSEIYVTDILETGSNSKGVAAICMIPDGYWYNEKNYMAVTYPQYDKNSMNYQKERNIGGAIRDLFSTAVLQVTSGVYSGS